MYFRFHCDTGIGVTIMFKLSLLVAVVTIGAALAVPIAEDGETIATERELQLRQGGVLAAILGQIGTALVPVFGAVLGPILTNLASGISAAFNNGLNTAAATPTKEELAAGSEDYNSGLVVRIPADSPLYALLIAHHQPDKDGLPSIGPSIIPVSSQKPLAFGGKLHLGTSDPAPVITDDRESISVDLPEYEEDDEDKIVNPLVKRYPQKQRIRTETDYAKRR